MLKSPIEAVKKWASQPDFDSWHGAPIAIIVSGDGSQYATMDCANAAQNMAVAAKSLGLGSCLGIPEDHTPIVALAVGYAAEDPMSRTPRKETHYRKHQRGMRTYQNHDIPEALLIKHQIFYLVFFMQNISDRKDNSYLWRMLYILKWITAGGNQHA